MKRITALLFALVVSVLALPALALDCSGPPVITGSVGFQASAPPNNPYISGAMNDSFEFYSLQILKSDGGTGKISFGAAASPVFHFGAACVTTTCSTPPPGRITKLAILSKLGGVQTYRTHFYVNNVRVFEALNLQTLGTTWDSNVVFSDGISVIRQDNPPSSRVYFEGWNINTEGVTYWKSVPAIFRNPCGYVT